MFALELLSSILTAKFVLLLQIAAHERRWCRRQRCGGAVIVFRLEFGQRLELGGKVHFVKHPTRDLVNDLFSLCHSYLSIDGSRRLN